MHESIENIIDLLDGFRSINAMTYHAYATLHDEISSLNDLLKRLEAVKPKFGEGSEGEGVFRCGSCGTALYHVFPWTKPGAPMKYASYCRNCGRPINWEPFEKSQE